jgi:predicted flavoprotein YhiN
VKAAGLRDRHPDWPEERIQREVPEIFKPARCPGLLFTREVLDVDGRLGGFNFQWAWSSAWVVASALARD